MGVGKRRKTWGKKAFKFEGWGSWRADMGVRFDEGVQRGLAFEYEKMVGERGSEGWVERDSRLI